jgi:putative colanic acid biosynthesis UDP-glucose lipid carrier transferase
MGTQGNCIYYTFRIILMMVDLLILNLTFWMIFIYLENAKDLSDVIYRHYLLVFNMIWLISSRYFNIYSRSTINSPESIYRATWKSLAMQIFLFVFYLMFTKDTEFSRYFLLLLFAALSLNFMISRFIGTMMESKIKRNFFPRTPVAILGNDHTSMKLAGYFQSGQNNFSFGGFLMNSSSFTDHKGRLLPEVSSAMQQAVEKGIKEIYVPLTMGLVEAGNLLREAEKQCIRLKFVPACLDKSVYSHLKIDSMGDFQVISLRKEPLQEVDNRFRKRAFDFAFSALVIIFILSWLYPILALIIKLQSKGPVLFTQLRSGRDNKTFICYKFRTMYVNADSDTVQASRGDKRITAFGSFMRKTNLDELPQFFNVLKGDMSVVGPRPHMLTHTEKYSSIINQFMVRHFLKPGITGWAQVRGFRGETKNNIQMKKRVEHDIWYLGNWSSMLDVRIIFLTAINMFKGEENAF